jgi:hypothetical protein
MTLLFEFEHTGYTFRVLELEVRERLPVKDVIFLSTAVLDRSNALRRVSSFLAEHGRIDAPNTYFNGSYDFPTYAILRVGPSKNEWGEVSP